MVVKGTRRLKIPSVSSSFVWNGQEVASLAGQGCLYILAKTELLEKEEIEELDGITVQVQCRCNALFRQACYRNKVGDIKLGKKLNG